ncbi:hypothetical protein BJI69_19715 [Luteibacter rhizovicinus DSM 16549]|uniref:Uncharacterized protein n=2 Tax=Luteibacter rhizovicinus TaxID=242606 RepID=A0A1L3EXX2_9GAMM|nr:hypothetical protein BJI69_19715 [Luteibacter rhizovicinus DSM 16549]KLD75506.1 hypothetical protein Y886_26690 [Xanthomonas hyacinthi DSM 19077]
MVLFTTKMRDLGWPSLPGLLGGAQTIEGRRSDPAIDDDWAEVLATLTNDDYASTGDAITTDAAYEVTFRFLVIQFDRRGLEYLGDVINRLSATASEDNAREVAEDWRDALSGT